MHVALSGVMRIKKSLTMRGRFIKLEANDSYEGVMSIQINNHQLSLIAALLRIHHGKGGDKSKERKGGFQKGLRLFFCYAGS